MRLKPMLFLCLLQLAAPAPAADCRHPFPANPLGAKIAAAALREYAEFNGHRINADGYLWKFGSTESESALLHDPDSGAPDARRPGRFAWRRVWEYWQTLATHVPGAALDRALLATPGLLDDLSASGATREYRLRELLAAAGDEESGAAPALREAAVRAAISDSAWSASFISYVMDRAGLDAGQFRFAAAHWQYVQRAFAPPDRYAYAACDPRSTMPAVGDLLCYARGAAPLKDFASWRDAAALPGFSAAAHCEVVTEVDAGASKIETVGGNVLQSVARRKLKLNQARLLSLSHDPDRRHPARQRACAQDNSCAAPNLNLQYWSVLLKLR